MKKSIILIFVMFLLLSCGKTQENRNVQKDSELETEADIKKKSEEAEKISAELAKTEAEKYNTYVELFNFLPRVDESIKTYINSAGDQEEVKIYSKGLYIQSIPMNEILKTKAQMNTGNTGDLDKTVQSLIPVLEELSKLLVESQEYYTARDYADDDYARGKELHKLILKEITRYKTTVEEFRSAMKSKSREVTAEELEEAKSKGDMITYYKLEVMQASMDITDELEVQGLTARNVTEGDLSKIKPLYDKFLEVQNKLREEAKNEESVKKAGYNSNAEKWYLESFIRVSLEFKGGALDLMERIEKKQKLEDFYLKRSTSFERYSGTPENLSRIYKELIKAYNK